MKASVDYWEIERRYKLKGDKDDYEFCLHAGINGKSYYGRRRRKQSMNLLVALLIAEYLDCDVKDFASVLWN